MWAKFNWFSNLVFRIFLALMIILFMFVTVATLLIKDLRLDADVMSIISLSVVLLSLPGIVNTLADEFNPKRRKVYKLSCKCPKCKHLIEMDMREI